jgi:beta-lactam-binding protein with PASTA domain/tRNA A-37 threonylcarbamoyl transferase component Bud32
VGATARRPVGAAASVPVVATSGIGDLVGRVLGNRYRLLRPLGQGASAYVYVAHDVRLDRRVAVKTLRPGLVDAGSFARFRTEAMQIATFESPNIVDVFDADVDGGSPYLVTRLLEGGSLRALLDRGHVLSPSQAALLGFGVASALADVHRRHVVHRDIKPANLLFDRNGRVRLADSAMARARPKSAATRPGGGLVGTVRYASPEQARGLDLDGRSDVYSLALVLVEAISGTLPFVADTELATLMARTARPLDVPERAGPLRPVLEAATTVDPDDRLDARTMVRRLEAVIRTLPPPAPLPLTDPAAPGGPGYAGGPGYDMDPTRWHDPVPWPEPAGRDGPAGDGVPVAPYDYGDADEEATPRRRRRRGLLAGLVVVLAAGAATGWVLTHRPAPLVAVPTLHGDTRTVAATTLARRHLVLSVAGRDYDAHAPAGTVTSQAPTGGQLREHRTVAVTLSLGPQPVAVPADLTGRSRSEATALIEAVGLRPGVVTRAPSITVPSGDVVRTSPSSGTLLPGSKVALVVSTGKPSVIVPRLQGTDVRSYMAAAAALRRAHLAPSEQVEYNDVVAKGWVIITSPAPGATAIYGTPVEVEISRGPHDVTVPVVAGLTVSQADQTLKADGLDVTGVTGDPSGRVRRTDPPSGRTVLYGAPIQIVTTRS